MLRDGSEKNWLKMVLLYLFLTLSTYIELVEVAMVSYLKNLGFPAFNSGKQTAGIFESMLVDRARQNQGKIQWWLCACISFGSWGGLSFRSRRCERKKWNESIEMNPWFYQPSIVFVDCFCLFVFWWCVLCLGNLQYMILCLGNLYEYIYIPVICKYNIYIYIYIETRSAHVISQLCLPGAPEAPAFLKLADACFFLWKLACIWGWSSHHN